MKWLFWGSAALIAYTYAGYPLWLWLRRKWRSRPVKSEASTPAISFIMAVRNEERALPLKLQNLLELDYPEELREIVVASDGSTDDTVGILQQFASRGVHAVVLPEHAGKAESLNRAISIAGGEILIFVDARQRLETDAVRRLVANFADPSVGCVSGELVLTGSDGETTQGAGLYWWIEKKIRRWEALTGSTVGATGALYAIRRKLAVTVPPGTLLDDVYIPLQVCGQGYRCVFEPTALVYDAVADSDLEFRRKVRTLLGNYQLVTLAPWLLTLSNPLLFEFVSHKILRLLMPLLLAVALIASLALASNPFYRAIFILQVAFYASAVIARSPLRTRWIRRIPDAAFTFVMLNTAAALAAVYFVTGKKGVWNR